MKKEVIYFTAKPNKTITVHKGIFKIKSEKDLKNQLQKKYGASDEKFLYIFDIN